MFPTYSLYAASKGAVEQMTRQLAKELGKKGISINANSTNGADS
jgi:3-oxoacyl-[acyl-carrier protein] reductase